MRIFSGVQPTGNIHIGNYLGALKQFVELQEENQCLYCVVDLHAITLPTDPKVLKEHILDVAALYMAVGIDPKKHIIFVQSDVPYHSELAWILMCNTYTGELSRMTQYKDKSKGEESSPAGLFTYPVLMAADILLYDTDTVPVGNDQKQHIEITRDIAVRVNNKFPGTFVVPEGRFLKEGARIMSLDDPLTKMSKSSPNPFSRISLLDDEDTIRKAVKKATTDSFDNIAYDEKNRPAVSNLLTIYSVFSGMTIEKIVKLNEGKGYGAFKKDLGEVIITALRPIKERYEEIRNSEELVVCLRDGSERAYALAEKTMKRVKDNFGLGTVS